VWQQAVEMVEETTSSSRLNAREVVVVLQAVETIEETTSSSRLDAREVVVVADGRNSRKNHLRLAFEREGGGGGGGRVERSKKTTSRSRLDAREVVVMGDGSKRRNGPPPARVWTRGRWWRWEACWKNENNHLRLAFGCEGGGGGGGRVETSKSTTSGSRLDAREVAVVAGTSGVVLSW